MAPKCANCGINIRWKPTVVDGREYCCVGCSHGGPCTSDYDNLPIEHESLEMVHVRSHVYFGTVRAERLVIRRRR